MDKEDILSLSLEELSQKLLVIGEKSFRAKQVFGWLHDKKVTDFSQMTNLSAQLREKLDSIFCIKNLIVKKRLVSNIDDTVKYLYMLPDGEKVETVLMSYSYGNSLCISTQVGCKMKCSFCASTIAGYVRNLLPSEMLLQIYETERNSGRHVDSIVLMGIGEPLDNFNNVIRFLSLVSDEGGRNMSLRHISVSTCGLVDRIKELADMKLGITLSISLHAANDEVRSRIMPVNERYHIPELMDACKYYFEKTGRRISFEFALIEGVNDDRATAEELANLLGPMNCHINLIPVNEIKENSYKKSTSVRSFQKLLEEKGLNATVRRTLGADISAACGQLRRDNI